MIDPRIFGSITHLLERRADERPGDDLLRFRGAARTFGDVARESATLAKGIGAAGLRPGDRFGLMLPNGLDFPVAWLAAARAGTPVVPLNPDYGEDDLAHVLSDGGVRAVLAGPGGLGRLEGVRRRCPGLAWVGTPAELRALASAGRRSGLAPDGPGPDTVVTVQYTSGTTGFPKGCALTHGYWLRLAATMQAYGRFGPDDVALTAQPFHYMDPTWNLVLCLVAGMPLVILSRFSASTFWRDVRDAGATFFYCIGTMPSYLFRRAPEPDLDRAHRVRLVLCSGIPADRHAAFEERWGCPWRETYGSTELGVVLMSPLEDGGSVGSGSMGVPVPGREVRTVDGEGRPLADGEAGELQVRGPDTMLGYWDGDGPRTGWLTADGWAATGDRVRREAHGYTHLGRLRDVIRRAGENIAAAEIEATLRAHPLVREAACVPVPDDLRGEEVRAYVQLVEGIDPATAPPETLAAFAQERLASFKVPRYWGYVDRFPLTASEKIAKRKLAAPGADPLAGAWDRREGSWR